MNPVQEAYLPTLVSGPDQSCSDRCQKFPVLPGFLFLGRGQNRFQMRMFLRYRCYRLHLCQLRMLRILALRPTWSRSQLLAVGRLYGSPNNPGLYDILSAVQAADKLAATFGA